MDRLGSAKSVPSRQAIEQTDGPVSQSDNSHAVHLDRLRHLILSYDGGDRVLFQVVAQAEIHLARRSAPHSGEIATLTLAALAAVEHAARFGNAPDAGSPSSDWQADMLALMEQLNIALSISRLSNQGNADSSG